MSQFRIYTIQNIIAIAALQQGFLRRTQRVLPPRLQNILQRAHGQAYTEVVDVLTIKQVKTPESNMTADRLRRTVVRSSGESNAVRNWIFVALFFCPLTAFASEIYSRCTASKVELTP